MSNPLGRPKHNIDNRSLKIALGANLIDNRTVSSICQLSTDSLFLSAGRECPLKVELLLRTLDRISLVNVQTTLEGLSYRYAQRYLTRCVTAHRLLQTRLEMLKEETL